jgi:hypothetical protein
MMFCVRRFGAMYYLQSFVAGIDSFVCVRDDLDRHNPSFGGATVRFYRFFHFQTTTVLLVL